ncbi:MAG: hypothetical protein ACOYXA_17780 [Bacteroidota bacterium]
MSREQLLNKTIANLSKLPDQGLLEVSDFAEFLLARLNGKLLVEEIQSLTEQSKIYKTLEEDPDAYSVSDLKNKYR